MKLIQSRDNATFKDLQRLARGKMVWPGLTQPILLEGVHLCQAWLANHGTPALAIFDEDRLRSNSELQALHADLGKAACVCLSSVLAKSVSQVEQGQGVFFVAAAPSPRLPSRITENCLWLDRVQDPGNVGTLLRTAAAVGMNAVYLSTGCAGAWTSKVLRSGQGAHFVLQIYENRDLLALRDRLDVPLLATALEGAVSLYELGLPKDCAWVFGHEGRGVHPELLQHADARVFIPQADRVESLNVGVAAGVCLFEQRRQHLAATIAR